MENKQSGSTSPFSRSGNHGNIHELKKKVAQMTDEEIMYNKKDNFPFEASSTYKGSWENTMKHGYGTQSLQDGTKYEGEWEYDKRHGKGILYNRVGKKLVKRYEGSWKANLKNGVGIYYYPNGDMYEGEWKDNKRHGKGKLLTSEGHNYEGEYCDGELHGECKVTYKNGNTFIGTYKNGKKDGRGQYFYITRKVYDGEYYDDQAVSGEFRELNTDEIKLFPYLASSELPDDISCATIRLPLLGLADPEEVLKSAKNDAEKKRLG